MHRSKLQGKSLKSLVSVIAILFLSRGAADARVETPTPTSQMRIRSDYADTFREFLSLFFPQLKREWVMLTVSEPDAFSTVKGRTREFFVSASLRPPDCGVPGGAPPPAASIPLAEVSLPKTVLGSECGPTVEKEEDLFKGVFDVSAESGEIQKFGYSAPPIEEKLQTVINAVRAHPEWSDEQATEELRNGGARFGPWNKPPLVGELPLVELARFFGKLGQPSVRFQIRAQNAVTEAGNSDAEMLWEVQLRPVAPSRSRVKYYWLLFEPFDGRLVSLGASSK